MAFLFDPQQPVAVPNWTNFSGTVGPFDIPHFVHIPGDPNRVPNALEIHANALREVLEFCFSASTPRPLRTLGSTWSFSSVIEPEQVVVDPGAMFHVQGIPHEHWTDEYLERARGGGFRPIFVEGGTGIGTLNDKLGRDGKLALQTSGAGNGHRMAGCIATGTHGSALQIGALHDTVLAMYLLISPDEAILVQSNRDKTFKPSIADWLQEQTKIPTRVEDGDLLLAAARVGLGSCGFVFAAIVEATGLYAFDIHRFKCDANDPDVLHALQTLDTTRLHASSTGDTPYHFDVVMNPYPVGGKKNWFATVMYKRPVGDREFKGPLQGIPRTTVDTMGLVSSLVEIFGEGLLGELTRAVVGGQICDQLNGDADPPEDTLFPGQVFGPTTLPRGQGASTEIAVDQRHAQAALDTVHQVLRSEADKGNLLLGVIAMRFVGRTRSLLGMNQFDKTCFIELPSIDSPGVRSVFDAVWQGLQDNNINFACHWGQLGGFSPARTQAYYGEHASQWMEARAQLLKTDTAMAVFGAKILKQAGLDGG
ncbi:MAG: hypothetical protein OXU20_21605 [Myxococcales bacterium]|nr:hypothetical protein [Myxococcales bacterium]